MDRGRKLGNDLRHLLAGAAILALAPLAIAAPITWGPATNTTGKAQLVEGDVILAIDGGNGVTITGGGASGTSTYVFTGGNYEDLTFVPAPLSAIYGKQSTPVPTCTSDFGEAWVVDDQASWTAPVQGQQPGRRRGRDPDGNGVQRSDP